MSISTIVLALAAFLQGLSYFIAVNGALLGVVWIIAAFLIAVNAVHPVTIGSARV